MHAAHLTRGAEAALASSRELEAAVAADWKQASALDISPCMFKINVVRFIVTPFMFEISVNSCTVLIWGHLG